MLKSEKSGGIRSKWQKGDLWLSIYIIPIAA